MDLRDEGGTWKPGSYPRSNTEGHGTGREKTMGTGTAGRYSGLGGGKQELEGARSAGNQSRTRSRPPDAPACALRSSHHRDLPKLPLD